MNNIVRGIFSGLLASLIVAGLYFVDYGPGNDYIGVANWFALGTKDIGKFAGFFVIIILGLVFGLIFGLLTGNRLISIGRAIVTGLGLGVAWWIIFALLVASIVGHASISHLTLGTFLYPFMLNLVYGVLLGAVYFQSTINNTESAGR